MRRGKLAAACLGPALLLLLLSTFGASPASACLRIQNVAFAGAGTEIVEPAAVADFLQIGSLGARQKIVARVTGPDGELAKRRVRALADLLMAYGLAPSGIMLETDRSDEERGVLIVYPPPRSEPVQTATAPAQSPPVRGCGG